MSRDIKLLDCTLRDGAYIVDSKFGAPAMKGIISKLDEAGVDIIECGWLKNDVYKPDTSFYHVPNDLAPYLLHKNKNKCYAAMIDWDRYDLKNLPVCDGNTLDAVRVVFPHGKYKEGIEAGEKIKGKGYQVFFQAANTLAYSDEDLIMLAREVNKVNPVSLSIVDTFGAMYEEDLEHIVSVLDEHLNSEIKLGFHSHNNQQLSFALTIHFIKILKETARGIIIDASLCGMGRGAGNATTELVVNYLNRKCSCHYNIDAIMDAIDIYMGYFQEKYNWGYSTPYLIAGMYGCHVNNIAYLLNNHRTNAHDMRIIIESMSAEDRIKYDYDLLEKKYVENRSWKVNDEAVVAQLEKDFLSRKILLVAPGKSSLDEQKNILDYIEKNHPIVIGVNAFLPHYLYDYIFFVNPARYEYAKEAYSREFNKTKRIVLSNIKCKADDGEMIIDFNSVIRRGWEHFDNAVICCLRLMERIGIKEVSIVGFDGFKKIYNESYGDSFLPSLNTSKDWDLLNKEITDIFHDFKKNALYCKKINFLTRSIFENYEEDRDD